MKRTVRLVSLMRWTTVAMNTALVLSVYLSVSTVPRNEGMWTQYIAALLLIFDLPVSLLILLSFFILGCQLGNPIKAVYPSVFIALGGLQWYLMASLLARWTCGFQKAMSMDSKRFRTTVILGLFLVVACGVLPWIQHLVFRPHAYSSPTTAFSGDSEDLQRSVVVPTLDTPMPTTKNVVWCAAFQLAWTRLGKDVLREQPIVQSAEMVVSRLNHTQVDENDLPLNSFAMAGLAKDGVVEKVKSQMKERFHKDVEIDPIKPNDIFTYAYLETDARFTIPFFDNRESLRFRNSYGTTTEVTSFGIEERHEYAFFELRKQIEVLYEHRNENEPYPSEFVLDLCRDSTPNQVVVACVPPKNTLGETLDDLNKKTQEFARQHAEEHWKEFGVRDVLLVPNLNWEVQHHFVELEGTDKRLLNAGFTDYHIAKAMQTIRFRLDRSGAELASEAQVLYLPLPTHYVFDRPFLIIVKKRGAKHPFFVMWVDNAELLCKP